MSIIKVFVLIIVAISVTCKSYAATQVDLGTWSAVQYEFGVQDDANWILSNGDTQADQIVNADASIFLGDFDISSRVIDGTWRVDTTSDNDFIGFVFGYQGRGQYYLFDWKQSNETSSFGFTESGMSIKVVNVSGGGDPTGDDLFQSAGTGNVSILKHNTTPWVALTDYDFHLEFGLGFFVIEVSQGGSVLQRWEVTDSTYTSGYFGFYNFSQGEVVYKGFTEFQQDKTFITGDIDNSGLDDIIVDFGSDTGTYVRLNNSSLPQLHALSPETMAIGNLDASSGDDVILDFGSLGTWVYMNNSTWVQLHALSPEIMITGDMDGASGTDAILDFGSLGTWVYMNNTSWVQLHVLSPEIMITGDMDGGGSDDVILDFGSLGTWVRMNNSTWVQLHVLSPETMTIGNIDGSSGDDVILDFGSLGIWARMNNSTWSQLHTLSAVTMTTGDVDGGGQDDVIIDFGAPSGVWIRMNNSTWSALPTP